MRRQPGSLLSGEPGLAFGEISALLDQLVAVLQPFEIEKKPQNW